MSWPTMMDYQEAIQNPRFCFADRELQQGTPVANTLGLPRPISGTFASVYQLACNGKQYAVRCFARYHPDQAQRYVAISEHLRRVQLPSMVTFNMLNQGIRVRGDWYPILKMEWIDGLPLNTYVERHLYDSDRLRDLAERFKDLTLQLEQASIAHGDLQHGNLLVVNHNFRLIDYDGMYVPALSGMSSHEIGHRNYQHPSRDEKNFGLYIDHFSAWVIYLSLRALSLQPALWRDLDAGDDCLLFRGADFANIGAAPVMQTLSQLRDPEVAELVDQFRRSVDTDLRHIPALNGAVSPGTSVIGTARRVLTRWWDDYVERPSPEEAPDATDESSAYGSAAWVLDYIDPTPPPEPAEETSVAVVERSVISLCVVAIYLTLVGVWLGLFAPIFAAGAVLIGTTAAAGFVIAQYTLFAEVREKRRLFLHTLTLRWEITVLDRRIQKFATDRQQLVQTETTTLALLEDVIDKAIEQELARYPLDRQSVPDLGVRLELRLRLAGVRTAGDVVEDRIRAVNGMDQRRADRLLDWRAALEQQVRDRLAPTLDSWHTARKTAIRQDFGRKRFDLDVEEAAHEQLAIQKRADLQATRQALERFEDVTFVAYLKWVF